MNSSCGWNIVLEGYFCLNYLLTQFPVTDALPRHGCPPVKVLVRVLDPELHVVVHAPHRPQVDQAPSTGSGKLEKQLHIGILILFWTAPLF